MLTLMQHFQVLTFFSSKALCKLTKTSGYCFCNAALKTLKLNNNHDITIQKQKQLEYLGEVVRRSTLLYHKSFLDWS